MSAAGANVDRAASCVTSRDGLIGTFEKAKNAVTAEKDAAIKPLAAILAGRYKLEEPEHEKVRDRAAQALAAMAGAVAGTY